jgi:serine/threonine-protein kinase
MNGAPPAAEGPLPERIGAYRIESRLGRGGMGEVFLAWDERLERRVAVKRIRLDADLPLSQQERFRREARSAARLSHPAIVQVHDLVSGEAGDAIVMEYVPGVSLAERLASGPLTSAEALRCARQIAEGLAAAHQAGVIHRDLKAENVLLTPGGQAKILDFGLALPVLQEDQDAALTQRGALVGTYHAMSPEQAGGGDVDARSDLFSLGALLSEMLTGRAPFRGTNPLDTLKRVLVETPPPLVLPGLPSGAAELIDRLLSKDREERPRDASEVALLLARIESRAQASRVTDSVSDLSTGPMPVTPRPPSKPLPPSVAEPSPRPVRRRRSIAAFLIVLAAALAAGGLYWARRGPDKLVRIAIAPPAVSPEAGDDERLRLAASGVLSATVAGLASLEGLAPIDPAESRREERSVSRPVSEMARVLAADEVVAADVERDEGTLGRVTLRRIQGSDGRVLWTETFQVPLDPDSLRLLADAVAVHLRRGYAGHRLRPGTPALDVRDPDYAAFLQVKQRLDAGESVLDPELARLETIVHSSPRFLEAQILAARVAFSLYQSKRETSYLDRAAAFVRQAQELAPNDPRPLVPEFQIDLAAGRTQEAAAVLARMEEVLPGDPEVLLQRSRLAEQQGRWDEALQDLRTAAARTPSWKYFFWLARLEGKRGQLAAAREHLETVLRLTPGNSWALEELAQLEMDQGDLAEAERLYGELAAGSQRSKRFTNLGTVRFLRGRYAEAAEAFRQALAIDPDQSIVLLNLADAETELGHTEAAAGLYGRALARIEANEPTVGLSPDDGMAKAECLARLGRPREAVALVQEILRRSPDEPDLLYEAALIGSLTGDRNAAVSNALAALDKGKSPRWFTGSAFRPLLADPELAARLAASSPTKLRRSEARPAERSGSDRR